MPRKSSKDTPVVISGVLYTEDEYTGTVVGSSRWFEWLADHTTFYYEGRVGTFTAHRELRRQGYSWYARRRQAGKLSKVYLGRLPGVTLERLEVAAGQLAVRK